MTLRTNRWGVAYGGTFTDVVLERGGAVFILPRCWTTNKAPRMRSSTGCTLSAPRQGIAAARNIGQIIHGTTAGHKRADRNGRGARPPDPPREASATDRMRTESPVLSNTMLNLTLPERLLPRQRRYTVQGRQSTRSARAGVPMDRAEVKAVVRSDHCRRLCDSVAVGLGVPQIFRKNLKRRRMRRLGATCWPARAPDIMVSLFMEVSPAACANTSASIPSSPTPIIQALDESIWGRLEGRLPRRRRVAARLPHLHSGVDISLGQCGRVFRCRFGRNPGPAGGAVFCRGISPRVTAEKGLLKLRYGRHDGRKICLIKDQTQRPLRVFEGRASTRFKKGIG